MRAEGESEGEGEGEGLRAASSPLGSDIASSSLGSSITSTLISSSRDAEMKPTRPSLSIRTRDHSGFVPFSEEDAHITHSGRERARVPSLGCLSDAHLHAWHVQPAVCMHACMVCMHVHGELRCHVHLHALGRRLVARRAAPAARAHRRGTTRLRSARRLHLSVVCKIYCNMLEPPR